VKVGTISVGLFATKDQEMEQRALLIKRLSFVIFSSEKEQYDRLMKQIQGTADHLEDHSQHFILFQLTGQ
jgi:hypothetical protein